MRKLLIAVGLAIVIAGLFLALRNSLLLSPGDVGASVSFWRGIAVAVIGTVIVYVAQTRKCPNCLHRFKANKPLCPYCRNVNISSQ
jgi:hypothetical protein